MCWVVGGLVIAWVEKDIKCVLYADIVNVWNACCMMFVREKNHHRKIYQQ